MNKVNREIIIALCAGEASGDLLGAHLIDAIKKRYPHSRFVGIGGPRMKAAGLISLYDQEPLAVRGYFEVLGNLFEILRIRRGLIADLKNISPHVFIGIDSPDFNLPLAAKLKSFGIPTLHYVSPSLWAWKGNRVKKIVKQVNQVLCLFPMEPALYQAVGGQAEFVGHPLAQVLPMENSKVAVRERLKLDITAPVFALLPGSRVSEIDYMAPVFLRAAALILQKLPDSVFLLPYPSALVRETVLKYLNQDEFKHLPVRLQAAKSELACMAADVALVTSGTAALEVALCKRPMVISYRISALTYALVRRKIKIPYIGLPNILLDKAVVPELIQKDATPEKLANAVLDWYYHPVRAAELEQEFARLHRSLRRNTDELTASIVLAEAGIVVPRTVTAEPEPEPETAPVTVPAAEPETITTTAVTQAEPTALPETAAVVQAAPEPQPAVTPIFNEPPPAPETTSFFGKVKKWFGSPQEPEPTSETHEQTATAKASAQEAAVRLAEDVAEAHTQQPTRHVLEQEELPAATPSHFVLPKSSILNMHRPNIFNKYREQEAEQAALQAVTPPPPVQAAAPEPVQPEPPVTPEPVQQPTAATAQKSAAGSVYAQYINQISMAWLPQEPSKRVDLQEVLHAADPEPEPEPEPEAVPMAQVVQSAVAAEQEVPPPAVEPLPQAAPVLQTVTETTSTPKLTVVSEPEAANAAPPVLAVEETAEEETAAAVIKRPSVSRYSSNPQRYGRQGGSAGIFY